MWGRYILGSDSKKSYRHSIFSFRSILMEPLDLSISRANSYNVISKNINQKLSE